jgi:hypothetical protein
MRLTVVGAALLSMVLVPWGLLAAVLLYNDACEQNCSYASGSLEEAFLYFGAGVLVIAGVAAAIYALSPTPGHARFARWAVGFAAVLVIAQAIA